MNPGTAAMRAAAIPSRPRYPPVVHQGGCAVILPARSKKNAPYRKAKGNGMRAGCIGCPRKLALLLMTPSGAWLAEFLLDLLGAVEMLFDYGLGLLDQLLQLLVLRCTMRLLSQVEYCLVDPNFLLDIG